MSGYINKTSRKLTEDHKRKISNALIGIKRSDEFKEKIRIANIGKKLSKEHIDKIALANTGKKRSEEFKNNIRMDKHPLWKGGKSRDGRGYVLIKIANHPFSRGKGYIYEHRHIIEEQIGRYLQPQETTHHINGVKDDNRRENLMAFSNQSAHIKYENGKEVDPKDIVFCGI